MSNSTLTLWVDVDNNNLLYGWKSVTSAKTPELKQGDQVATEIHWLRRSPFDAGYIEELPFPSGSVVRMAIGGIDSIPTSGSFVLTFVGDSITIPATETPANLATALNAMPSIISAGGVGVMLINGNTYRVTFNQSGSRTLISTNSSNLEPSATAVVQRVRAGNETTREVQNIKLKCVPIAYTGTFTDTPSATLVSSTVNSNTVRFSFDYSPKAGTWAIYDGTSNTPAIPVSASALDVYNALVSGGIATSTYKYSVNKVGNYTWDITQTAGIYKNLTSDDSGVISFNSKSGVIDLNTMEVEDFIGGNSSVDATIEIEVSDGNSRQTIYQGTVSIINDLIDASTYNPSSLTSPASQADVDQLRVDVNALQASTIPFSISSPTNNQVLSFDSSSNLWKNKNTLSTFELMDGGNF